jgi:formate dehydrogenase iron-sulfur subunit
VSTNPRGFFTDPTVCIGCKACEVACKQWNQIEADGYELTGDSYDNTSALGASSWRHVAFVEQKTDHQLAWLMLSDVCKHCERAGCLEACPTGAIIRTEFGSVYIQPDVCNGCGYCVPSCPFGVVELHEADGRAWKCTLCYDRLKGDLEPACAKACPTDSIQYGPLDELQRIAERRVEVLRERGVPDARLYGLDQPGTGGLHAFFLLTDRPEVYNLPPNPAVPTRTAGQSWAAVAGAAVALGVGVLAAVVGR